MNLLLDAQTVCDYESDDKGINDINIGSFQNFEAIRYRNVIHPYKIEDIGSGTITLEGGTLNVEQNKLYYNGNEVRDYGNAPLISYPLDLSEFDAVLVEGGYLYALVITSLTAGQLRIYTELNGKFDITEPYTFTTVPLRTLPGKVKYYIARVGHQIIANNGTQISINGGLIFTYQLPLDTYIVSDVNLYYFTPQWNEDHTTTQFWGETRVFNPANSSWTAIPGSFAHFSPNGLYHYLTISQQPGNLTSNVLHYVRNKGSAQWTAVTYQEVPANTTVYKYTRHPLDPFLIVKDANSDYFWVRTGAGRRQFETYYHEDTPDNKLPLTDPDTDKFNRVFLQEKAGILYLGPTVFGASYDGVLLSPANDTHSVDITLSGTTNHFQIELNDGTTTIISVSNSFQPEVVKVDADMYRINVADIYNIISINNGKISVHIGASDWNNRIKPEQVLALNSSSYQQLEQLSVISWNSAFSANYEVTRELSTSLLYGSPFLTSYSRSNNELKSPLNSYWKEIVSPLLPIDYYWKRTTPENTNTTPTYFKTGSAYLFNGANVSLNGLNFPEPTSGTIASPMPVNSLYRINYLDLSIMQWLTLGYFGVDVGRDSILSYFITSYLDALEDLFYLGGMYYSYDGEVIWSIQINNNVVENYTPVVRCAGLKFIGNRSSEAYFWSDYDNSIYLYRGDQTLILGNKINGHGLLVYGSYCQYDDRLSLLFENDAIIFEHDAPWNFSSHILNSQPLAIGTGYLFEDPVTLIQTWKKITPIEETDIETPLVLETNWLGSEDDTMTVDVRNVYVRGGKGGTVQISSMSREEKNGIEWILKDEWTKITPPNFNAQLWKLKITSPTKVYSISTDFEINQKIVSRSADKRRI